MNLKLLTATTLFLTIGTAIPAFSADEKESETFVTTRQCVDCNLSQGSFLNENLQNANLQGANLYSGSFHESDLRNANFSRTNSKEVTFSSSDLRNANFSHADVSGASFCNADLRGVNWTGVIFNDKTQCLPDEAINYVPTANIPTPSTDNNQLNPSQTNSVVSEPVAPVTPTPVAPENPVSIQDTLNGVRQNVNTVRDILNIFR
ncbi:MAG: pentapeptide repeat-containing protein [Waterburya sp.]